VRQWVCACVCVSCVCEPVCEPAHHTDTDLESTHAYHTYWYNLKSPSLKSRDPSFELIVVVFPCRKYISSSIALKNVQSASFDSASVTGRP